MLNDYLCLASTGPTAMMFRYRPGSMLFLPPGATPDARLIVMARGVRAFGDGLVSLLLPLHLITIGLSAGQVGLVTTATLLGSAILTLLAGALASRWKRHDLLVRASLLMILTGIGFALADAFWP